MVSKQKILKGLDDHLTNIYCAKIDLELDESISKETKESSIGRLRVRYSNLMNIRTKLQELLVG
jgi:hypothetical protein